MDVRLSLIDDEVGEELRSLNGWLSEDEDLGGLLIELRQDSAGPEHMGPVPDLIQTVISPGGAFTAFITAIGTWLTARRRTIKVRVRVGDNEVEIEGAKIRDSAEFVKSILAELPDQ